MERLDVADFQDLIGLPLNEFQEIASSRGATVRVVATDGTHFPCTKDFRPNRLNVTTSTVEGQQMVTSLHNFC
jgi:hypothetical protein